MTLFPEAMPESAASPWRLAEVAPDLPLFSTFHYRIPIKLRDQAGLGKRVLVPFGRRQITGYLIGFAQSCSLPEDKIKDILKVLDPEPLFDQPMLDFFRFSSVYYFAPLGEVIKSALPAGINLASRKRLRLSEEGRKVLANGHLPMQLEETAKKLKDAIGLSATQVKKSDLIILRHRGWIEEFILMTQPRVSHKSEWALELATSPDEKQWQDLRSRSKQQARLLEQLTSGESLFKSDLSKEFKDPLRLARQLQKKGFVKIFKRVITRDPFSLDLKPEPPPSRLMPEQAEALQRIEAALDRKQFTTFLLRGVTGSGKTEVYLRAIRSGLDRGRTALVLVPEIALTPQLLSRFRHRFPEETIALLHSGLSAGERFDQWWLIRSGRARIVLGARSAVFAPLKDLGLIVVDEEHETAYKQEDVFSYHGRDLAVVRGQREQAVVVLGSATPSLESSFNAQPREGISAKYQSLILSTRVDRKPMPVVEIVDMRGIHESAGEAFGRALGPERSGRRELSRTGTRATPEVSRAPKEEDKIPADAKVRESDRRMAESFFSPALKQALQQTLARGDQAILFLNRRGFASFLLCYDCGQRFLCPNCSVSLTWHRKASKAPHDRFYGEEKAPSFLLCHYCGFHAPAPEVCPQCFGLRVRPLGLGTERVEDEIAALLPGARLARMDSDTMSGKRSYFELLDKLRRRELDLLVGTQMVAKGHDFPHVTLVGVLLADLSLNFPDFRAGERTFQLLTQVAGRAGRGEKPGRVIVQTFNPEHYSIRLAVSQDYEQFYQEEMKLRQALAWPPYQRLANFRISAPSPERAADAASDLRRLAKTKARRKEYRESIGLLGPVRAPLSRLRGKSRWQMLVRAGAPSVLAGFCGEVFAEMRKKFATGKVVIALDRDPVDLL